MTVDYSSFALPKKKWLNPEKSKTMKAECPEDKLQKFANEYLDTFRIKYFRISDDMWTGLKLVCTGKFIWLFKKFGDMFGGRLPDNLVYVPLGEKYWLVMPMEIKTQDKKGRAVGKLHGKQKNNAVNDNWVTVRSPEQIQEACKNLIKDSEKIKRILEKK